MGGAGGPIQHSRVEKRGAVINENLGESDTPRGLGLKINTVLKKVVEVLIKFCYFQT